jgi:hypothetical protein
VDDQGRLLLSSEGLHSDVLRLRLPRDVRALLAPAPSSTPGPTPSTGSSTPAPSEDPTGEAATTTQTDRPAWPWLVSGLVGVGVVAVLVRSLRPR